MTGGGVRRPVYLQAAPRFELLGAHAAREESLFDVDDGDVRLQGVVVRVDFGATAALVYFVFRVAAQVLLQQTAAGEILRAFGAGERFLAGVQRVDVRPKEVACMETLRAQFAFGQANSDARAGRGFRRFPPWFCIGLLGRLGADLTRRGFTGGYLW